MLQVLASIYLFGNCVANKKGTFLKCLTWHPNRYVKIFESVEMNRNKYPRKIFKIFPQQLIPKKISAKLMAITDTCLLEIWSGLKKQTCIVVFFIGSCTCTYYDNQCTFSCSYIAPAFSFWADIPQVSLDRDKGLECLELRWRLEQWLETCPLSNH